MNKRFSALFVSAACALAFSAPASATVITFDGGTTNAGSTAYEEDGFRVSTIAGTASFGDYYGTGNNVVHAHWGTGSFGTVTGITITKVGGGSFDLNYFKLTSNTDTGGGPASGSELTWVEGYLAGSSTGAAVLLPPEDWGFPAAQIFLGSQFDVVDEVRFFVTSAVDCFGMDEFFINEAAPGVPEPASAALLGLALAGLAVRRRKRAA